MENLETIYKSIFFTEKLMEIFFNQKKAKNHGAFNTQKMF